MNQLVVQDEKAGNESAPGGSQPAGRSVAVVGMVLTLIVCLVVAWLFYSTNKQRAATDQVLTELRDRLTAQENARKADDQAAAQLHETMATAVRDLEARIEETERTLGRRGWDWMLAEAEYLLSLANEQLLLNRNIVVAIAALETADARLRRADIPETLAVRNEIAKSIAALQAAERPDVPGYALKLATLIEQVRLFPLARAQVVSTSSGEGAADTTQPVAGMLNNLWKRLTALIVVRQSDKALPALLAPEEVLLLRLNLELQLESARVALLRNDQANFNAAVRGARESLAEYFDRTAPEVNAAVEQLQVLEQANIALQVPDVSAPLNALRKVRSQLDLHNAKPAKASTAAPTASGKSP